MLSAEYSLLRFWGGDERGACLQITPLNQNSIEWLVKKDGSKVKVGDYIHLTRNQVVELRDKLDAILDSELWVKTLGEMRKALKYTGFEDKNGVKIFKGSIINLGEIGHSKSVVVVSNKGCFGIKAPWVQGNKFIPLFEYCNTVFSKCVEVIGHIRDNSEL